MLDDSAFQVELAAIAERTGQQLDSLQRKAHDDLKEMKGDRSGIAVKLFAWLSRYLCRRGYHDDYYYDLAELQQVKKLAANQSVVYLVSHKTYLDFFVLFDFFYRSGVAPPFIFGGVNMAFAGFGMLARKAGGIFIRRSFADDPVYKAVLRRYIQHLITRRCSFMWAIEGTRSRTGKLVLPKLGLLKYVSEASRPLGDEAVTYIPVSVSYDQIPDVIDMAAQESGVAKKPESLGWFAGYVRGLDQHFGNIYIRFGEPVSLHETPDAPDLNGSEQRDPAIIEVQKLAFEVCYRINEVTPVTETSLVLMSLLCRISASGKQIQADVRALYSYIKQRESSAMFHVPNRPLESDVESTLVSLTANKIIGRGNNDELHINADRYLVALYYSNMAVHHFVIAAFTELGLLNMTHGQGSSEATFRSEVNRLRDVFKFEFFFSRRRRFAEQLFQELEFLDADLDALREHGKEAAAALLRRQPLPVAHGVLSPFVAAYRIVASRLLQLGQKPVSERSTFIAGCQAWNRTNEDANGHLGLAPKALLNNGYRLAENRGLLDGGAGCDAARERFVEELTAVSRRLDEIRAMTH